MFYILKYQYLIIDLCCFLFLEILIVCYSIILLYFQWFLLIIYLQDIQALLHFMIFELFKVFKLLLPFSIICVSSSGSSAYSLSKIISKFYLNYVSLKHKKNYCYFQSFVTKTKKDFYYLYLYKLIYDQYNIGLVNIKGYLFWIVTLFIHRRILIY